MGIILLLLSVFEGPLKEKSQMSLYYIILRAVTFELLENYLQSKIIVMMMMIEPESND